MVIAALLLTLAVAGPFGAASAEATVIDSSTVEVALSVEAPAGTSVVAHVFDPGSDQRTVAMLESRPGEYRTRLETRPVDLVVVFEDLGSGVESDPTRLTAMGAAPELLGVLTPPDGTTEEGSSMGWLAAGLGLASLSALAFWALGGRNTPEPEPEPAEGAAASTE